VDRDRRRDRRRRSRLRRQSGRRFPGDDRERRSANVVYGWLYWWRGLELAILPHMVVDATLYIAVPVIV